LDAKDDESELDELGREERRLLLAKQSWNLFRQEAVMHQKLDLMESQNPWLGWIQYYI